MTDFDGLAVLLERLEEVGRDIRRWVYRQEHAVPVPPMGFEHERIDDPRCGCGHDPIQHTPQGVCLVPGCQCGHGPTAQPDQIHLTPSNKREKPGQNRWGEADR